MSFIESQRLLLEELDTLELALESRLKRYPHLLLSSDAHLKNRSHTQNLLQVHELKFLRDKYKESASRITKGKRDVFEASLKSITDPTKNLRQFDTLIADLNQKHQQSANVVSEDLTKLYAMYSSAPTEEVKHSRNKHRVKRKYALSLAASHIVLDSIFTPSENYGRYFDLVQFHDTFKELSNDMDVTYMEYLALFDKFPYENVNTSSLSYKNYLHSLLSYLISFYNKVYPLENITDELAKISVSLQTRDDGQVNEKGEVYCVACNKLFAKQSVYQGHLNGKKHRKNAAGDADSITTSSSTKLDELHITEVARLLSDVRQATVNNTERKAALTERERIIEELETKGEESEFTSIESSGVDSDGDFSDDGKYSTSNLPLGADGQPIPYWLYKLQGLNHLHNCEICGNISYKGRALFTKHFGGTKHQYGLKCLGISEEYIPLFKSITSISEATEFWKQLKRERRLEESHHENAVQVEDDQGNVMSEKDYLDLKRQGLL